MTTENRTLALALITTLTATDVARQCYDVDRFYSTANGTVPTLGFGGVGGTFDQLPQDRREIIIAGVNKILETPAITPEQLHEHWMGLMKVAGWTRGGTTNIERKQHALLVPYTELAAVDQVKAGLFITIVRAVTMPATGGATGSSAR